MNKARREALAKLAGDVEAWTIQAEDLASRVIGIRDELSARELARAVQAEPRETAECVGCGLPTETDEDGRCNDCAETAEEDA